MSNGIPNLLRRIRYRIRLFVMAEAGLVLAIVLALLFWIGLLLDWWWEPSRNLRLLAWWGVGIGLVALLHRLVWLRLRRPLPDQNVALLVERAYPELRDRLMTAVAPVPAANSEPFLHFIRQQATELTYDFAPARVVSLKSLGTRFAIAIALVATVAGFAFWQQEAFATWMDRLALSEARWPRRVRLLVDGFEPDEQGRLVRSVPRFESAELVVRADLTGSFEAPSEVEVRYRSPDQVLQRALCARVGEAEKGRDATQEYRYQFAELRESLILEVRGGDDRLTNLYINVLPRPRILSLKFDAVYPAYLGMSPRRLTVSSVITVPLGTTLTISGRASQPLARVDIATTIEGLALPIAEVDATDRQGFQLKLEKLPSAGELSLLPVDTTGVTAREPYLLTFIAQADELPTIAAQLVGISSAVTPEARIPLRVHAEDDHAVDRMWIDLLVDGQPASTIPLPTENSQPTANAATEVDFFALAATESEPLVVKPGQRISLVARAQDGFDLSDEPRIGASHMITLDVVTGDQLLDSMAREEMNLRRTFERVIEKTVQSRDNLSKVTLGESENPEETLQAARIQLARSGDDMQQVIDESLGVAAGFQLIHDQLVNNRVGDDELKSRLRERIAEPLRSIADRELRQLATAIDDTGQMARLSNRDVAGLRGRMTTAIDHMQTVLAEMKSLETYSEVVTMLRKLIQEQQVLTEKTRDGQRQQLRSLLED